jgi:hypothetical protein
MKEIVDNGGDYAWVEEVREYVSDSSAPSSQFCRDPKITLNTKKKVQRTRMNISLQRRATNSYQIHEKTNITVHSGNANENHKKHFIATVQKKNQTKTNIK